MTGVDPVLLYLDPSATREDYNKVAAYLGLDKPLHIQYLKWVMGLLHGDMGNSIVQPYPVNELVFNALPNTIALSVVGMVLAVLYGVPIGVLAAVKRGQTLDVIARTFAIIGQSAPSFLVGLVLILLLTIKVPLFPIIAQLDLKGLILPSITNSALQAVGIMRLARSGMIEALDSDYVTLARMKGLSEKIVLFKHALKNTLIPVITFSGMYFALGLSGAVITEVVFSWPGIGLLTYRSALSGDYPVMQGVVVLVTALTIASNLIVDILYAFVDPRIRYRKV
jgi:peptide/nickel transport system permease protein